MITGKEHQNKWLVSITDGKKVGEIKDLYLDKELTKVVAVLAGKEGFIQRKKLVVERTQIQVYGEDVWLVASSEVVMDLETVPDADSYVLLSELRGREVHTEGGTKVGTVEDVLLDRDAHVLGIALGKVYVQGPLAERKAIARGAISKWGSKDVPMTIVMAQAEVLSLAE